LKRRLDGQQRLFGRFVEQKVLLPLPRIKPVDLAARSIVTILTELSRLQMSHRISHTTVYYIVVGREAYLQCPSNRCCSWNVMAWSGKAHFCHITCTISLLNAELITNCSQSVDVKQQRILAHSSFVMNVSWQLAPPPPLPTHIMAVQLWLN
jgi:hypothetical protein